MAKKRTDGRAVDVLVSGAAVEKDAPVYFQGFHGFTMDRAEVGELVAIDVAEQVWEIEIPSALAAAKGATLSISTDGNHTIGAAEAADSVPFVKVVEAKDANNIVWAKQLPQA